MSGSCSEVPEICEYRHTRALGGGPSPTSYWSPFSLSSSGGSRAGQSYDNMEWNFSNTIRRGQPQESQPESSVTEVEEDERGAGETGEGGRRGTLVDRERRDTLVEGDTRRHTLTGPVELESPPIRTEIDDTVFVSIGNRSSVVIGERKSGSGEGVSREGGEGGKGCELQEPERTRGDGQEAESRHEKTPSSSTLQHTILPLLAQVNTRLFCNSSCDVSDSSCDVSCDLSCASSVSGRPTRRRGWGIWRGSARPSRLPSVRLRDSVTPSSREQSHSSPLTLTPRHTPTETHSHTHTSLSTLSLSMATYFPGASGHMTIT